MYQIKARFIFISVLYYYLTSYIFYIKKLFKNDFKTFQNLTKLNLFYKYMLTNANIYFI
jgi:hypothetical protein